MTDVVGKPLISFGVWFYHMVSLRSRRFPACDSQLIRDYIPLGATETIPVPGGLPASRLYVPKLCWR